MKMNCDIRAAMARSDLRQYQIAAALGISESRYSSKLRKELSIEEKSKIFEVIMTLLENGAWAACRAPQSPAKVFQTQEAARDYLSDCESVIIIDL